MSDTESKYDLVVARDAGETLMGRVKSGCEGFPERVTLINPLIVQRIYGVTPQGQPGFSLQLLNDPHFPHRRGFELNVNLTSYKGWYVLRGSESQNESEFMNYERMLGEAWAAAAGLKTVSSARRP